MVENYICEAWFGASKGNRYFLKTRNNKLKKGSLNQIQTDK